jgi:branched-chain amino acid transport system permease protein
MSVQLLIQQLINGVSIGGVYALMATGYALIYSLLGFSNWAHGDVAMVGAYIGILTLTTGAVPFWVAVIIAILGAGLVSILNERLAYRRIRNNNSPTMFLMIAAMGLSVTLQNAILVIVGPKFKTF